MGGLILKLFIITLSAILLVPSQTIYAQEPTVPKNSTVVINELQTNGVGTGTTAQEFIELKNISDTLVDVSGWRLQYISSTGNLATAKYFSTFETGTIIYPGGFLLVTPDSYLIDVSPKKTYVINSSFSGLASTGGTVQLVNQINAVIDMVGWGTKTTTLCETELAVAPGDGQSIQRRVVDTAVLDTDNNKTDFELLTQPTPETQNVNPNPDTDSQDDTPIDTTQPDPNSPVSEPIADEQTDTPTEQSPELPPVQQDTTPPVVEQPIKINELFIDPESPQTDANDEWVELYNPGTTDQDLGGYTVYAGDTYAYHHTFAAGVVIAANGYISITSKDTSIALANGGGKVKITGPTGTIYDEVTYTTAKSGEAWAKDDSGIWVWTTTPSQNSVNIITQPVAVAVIAKASTTAKKTTAKAATATKTTTPKTATTKVKGASTGQDEQPKLVSAPTPLPIWLLALLGVLAVLYSGYEYRFDIANKIYQLRQHRTNRRANR